MFTEIVTAVAKAIESAPRQNKAEVAESIAKWRETYYRSWHSMPRRLRELLENIEEAASAR